MHVVFHASKVNFRHIKTVIHMYFKWQSNFWFELYFTILLGKVSYWHPHALHMKYVYVCMYLCLNWGGFCMYMFA